MSSDFEKIQEGINKYRGTIYVCSIDPSDPKFSKYGNKIYKIGVTSGDVDKRTARSESESEFLNAKIKIEDSYYFQYKNAKELEKNFHDCFRHMREEIPLSDRNPNESEPEEWFRVPLKFIKEAIEIERTPEKSIEDYVYDPKQERIREKTEDEKAADELYPNT